ncbi:MAG: nicotinate (nicotinamide) nucleotide adenylyltransferase [Candidatus Dormibacteria bacterium]
MSGGITARPAEPRRLVILGGTFDPVHTGHMAILEQTRVALGADMGWLLPTGDQPLRESAVASAADRLAMAEAAVRDQPHLAVSDLEARRPGRSYTVETAAELSPIQLGVERWWLLGADAARRIREWRRWPELLQRERFALVNRAGVAPMGGAEAEALGFAAERSRLLAVDSPPVSASEVRRRLAAGESLAGMLPDAVAQLIRARGLYGTATTRPGDNAGDDLR